MLVLKRMENEEIVIADNIVIRILSTDEKYVRLGISAPKEVSVDRREIWVKKQAEQVGA